MENDQKGAGVRFPPPLVYLLALSSAWGVNYFIPLAFISIGWRLHIAALVFLLGAFIAIAAVLKLHFSRTSIEPWKPTSKIVDRGIFGYSRNPIYLSFNLVGIALAIFFNSAWMLFSLIPATMIIVKSVIAKEEHYLASKFGQQYTDYCENVNRWWGCKK
jgi:protein-S-isoprenylcysteine O-methyltransferase Ste14